MEAKLIKVDNGWILTVDNIIYATDENAHYARLSLKNCQSIENGYDLDKLAKEKYPYEKTEIFSCFELDCKQEGFIDGVKTILEILGDKKFNEEDMIKCFNASMDDGWVRADFYIQSLQQTEWDVEIEMICPHPMDTYRCGLQYGCDGDGCNHPNQVPYLDADGCLILKRKI